MTVLIKDANLGEFRTRLEAFLIHLLLLAAEPSLVYAR
jgi:hypothetical protein